MLIKSYTILDFYVEKLNLFENQGVERMLKIDFKYENIGLHNTLYRIFYFNFFPIFSSKKRRSFRANIQAPKDLLSANFIKSGWQGHS